MDEKDQEAGPGAGVRKVISIEETSFMAPFLMVLRYRVHPILHPRGTIQLYRNWPGVMVSGLLGLPEVKICRLRSGIAALMRPGSVDQFAAREILLWNLYDIHESDIREDDVVLDVGAHIGLFSLSIQKFLPAGRVLAIEPDPENFALLVRNITKNRAQNVTPLNLALTGDARERTKVLYRTRANNGGHSICVVNQRFLKDSITVDADTIEGIMARFGLQRVDVVKLDCEGAEHEILEHLSDSVLRRIRRISLEWHKIDANHGYECLSRLLRENGFDVTVTINGTSKSTGYIFAKKRAK